MSVLVVGCGNPSRGDDALGPALIEHVRRWSAEHPESDVSTAEDFQLQIEHVLDLEGRERVVFVDADVCCAPPFELRPVVPSGEASWTTHRLSPAALLQVYRSALGTEPPPSFVLSVRGERFGLGEPLSEAAERNLKAAWNALRAILASPSSRPTA